MCLWVENDSPGNIPEPLYFLATKQIHLYITYIASKKKKSEKFKHTSAGSPLWRQRRSLLLRHLRGALPAASIPGGRGSSHSSQG